MNRAEPILIFETVHGSRAYGLAQPGSDTDLKGVVVGPPAWYFGFRDAPEQLNLSKDHVRYEVRKLLRLAAAANPTILELLWIAPEHHRVVTPAGERLLAARQMFLTRRVAQTFGGYALSQLKRIRTHRRWLLHPPEAEPTREAFGLPEKTVVPRDQLGAAEAMLRDGRMDDRELSPNFLRALERERAYRSARREWGQYQRWLRERNPARAELERRFGYDTKHAQHLVRLLRMGVECLETGRLKVTRDDRDELLAIRAGAWTYDEVVDHAEALNDTMERAARSSALPDDCDEDAADRLCVELIEAVHREHYR